MEQPSAVVKYKKLVLGGLMGTAFVAVQLVVYIYLNDLFVNKIVLPIAMVLEMAINVWMFLKGLREDHLDERGITVKTPFGTKHHPWAAVESYGIEVVQTRRDCVPRIMSSAPGGKKADSNCAPGRRRKVLAALSGTSGL